MIVAIAERIHEPRLDAEDVWRWDRAWHTATLSCILSAPTMTQKATRTRLNRLMGVDAEKVVNLLPPHNRPGVWDQRFARECVTALVPWLRENAEGVILLGRRVINVFTSGGEFCSVTEVGPVPALCLPHPSGRSRFLNEPANRERVQAAIREFAVRTIR